VAKVFFSLYASCITRKMIEWQAGREKERELFKSFELFAVYCAGRRQSCLWQKTSRSKCWPAFWQSTMRWYYPASHWCLATAACRRRSGALSACWSTNTGQCWCFVFMETSSLSFNNKVCEPGDLVYFPAHRSGITGPHAWVSKTVSWFCSLFMYSFVLHCQLNLVMSFWAK